MTLCLCFINGVIKQLHEDIYSSKYLHIGEPRQRTFSTDLLNPPGRNLSAQKVPLGLKSSSTAVWTQNHRQQDFTFGPCEGLSEDKLGHRQGCDYWPFWGV